MQNDTSKNRKKLILVVAIFLLPIMASYFAYYVWNPQGAVGNYGELIPPVTLSETITLTKLGGGDTTLKDLRGKWILVQVDAGACDTTCEQKRYAMRQARLMQGREQDRVVRLWLVADHVAPNPLVKKKIEDMLLLKDASGALIAKLPAPINAKQHIYFIDPLGNLMMRWPANPDINLMHKDMKRLLKYSQIG